MNLNDLLRSKNINPEHVLVVRHTPTEPELRKVLPWLAAEQTDTFNAYQQTQGKPLEKAMQSVKKNVQGTGDVAAYVASFIGHEPSKALFVGLYKIGEFKPLTYKQFWQKSGKNKLKDFGYKGGPDESGSILWFDLELMDFYASWKGKLIVNWPPGMAWWRWAHKNIIPVHAILEESALTARMPEWNEIDLNWEELSVLPTYWKTVLSQWRGIYYIFDTSDCKDYVGSAYGHDNILGRWLDYASSGDGGNQLLKGRCPRHFRFSILQLVAQDMKLNEIVPLERTWKVRLHTLKPNGLNIA